MMTALFPPAFWEQEYGAALFPFQLRAFYATPPFRRSLMNEDGTLQGRANFLQKRSVEQTWRPSGSGSPTSWFSSGCTASSSAATSPSIFTTTDSDTGLDRHFRLQFDWRFVEVRARRAQAAAHRRGAAAAADAAASTVICSASSCRPSGSSCAAS